MKSRCIRHALAAAVVPALALGSAGLFAWRVHAAEAENHVPVPVSINALMVAVVDHSAHAIWDAGNVARNGGTLTGRDWQEVEQHSIQLAASGTLISLGGTGTADFGRVESPAWQGYARQLTEAAMAAHDAVENQDQMALADAGDTITATCESCHQTFKPDAPTEGILHVPHYPQ